MASSMSGLKELGEISNRFKSSTQNRSDKVELGYSVVHFQGITSIVHADIVSYYQVWSLCAQANLSYNNQMLQY